MKKSHRLDWNPKLGALLVIGYMMISGCAPEPGPMRINRDPKLLEEFRAWAKAPLSVSPNTRRAAFSSSRPGEPFGIEIRDVATNVILQAMYSKRPILRVTWRPDGDALAYFRQEPSADRTLFFWNLREDRHIQIATPVSRNQYEVKWSPDGRCLAFTSDREKLVLASLREVKVINEPVRVFSWKADASLIAAIPEGVGVISGLLFIDPEKGRVSRTAAFSGNIDLVEIDWNGGSNVLCLGRDKTSNVHQLFFIDPERKEPIRKIPVKNDLGSPMWTPDGAEIVWDSRGSRGWARLIATDTRIVENRVWDFPGDAKLRGFSPDGRDMIVSVVASARNELLRVPLATSYGQQVLAKAATLSEQEATNEVVDVVSPAKGSARLFISRLTDPRRDGHAAIIRVLGGAHPQYVTDWTERHFYVSHGVTYVSVARRTEENVDDILQSCDYISEKFNISREHIAIYGQSSVAPSVIKALIKQPKAAGTFAVAGLGTRIGASAVLQHPPFRLMVFHGGSDAVKPTVARDILIDAVGQDAINSSQVLWRVFPGEGHTLYEADGVVNATLLSAVGAE